MRPPPFNDSDRQLPAGKPADTTRLWQPDDAQPVIRRLGPQDSEAIVEHYRRLDENDRYLRFFRIASEASIRSFVEGFDWSRTILVGALVDGVVCGLGEIGWSEASGPFVAEFAISVDRDWRHRGLAGWLMDAACDIAFREGVHAVEVRWLSGNDPVHRLVRRRGGTIQREGSVLLGTFYTDRAARPMYPGLPVQGGAARR